MRMLTCQVEMRSHRTSSHLDKTSCSVKNVHMTKRRPPSSHEHLLEQLDKVSEGLAQTFAPFCEVVVHDLTHPKHAITSIHNNLSGRKVGAPATELGLARIADSNYPQVLANYPNRFSDGRPVKSTSIGIKNPDGEYVAALCLNLDLGMFQSISALLRQFTATNQESAAQETLDPASADAIRARIDQFAAALMTSPRALKAEDRRELMKDLKLSGCMDVRYATEIVSQHLGVSRATVYSDAKQS